MASKSNNIKIPIVTAIKYWCLFMLVIGIAMTLETFSAGLLVAVALFTVLTYLVIREWEKKPDPESIGTLQVAWLYLASTALYVLLALLTSRWLFLVITKPPVDFHNFVNAVFMPYGLGVCFSSFTVIYFVKEILIGALYPKWDPKNIYFEFTWDWR